MAEFAQFTVREVIDGSTFALVPKWKWQGLMGDRVRAAGYDVSEVDEPEGQVAKDKLLGLILGKRVELRKAHKVDCGQLVCDVFFPGANLAAYFPEYENA